MRNPLEYSSAIQKKLTEAITEKYGTIEGKKRKVLLSHIHFDPLPNPDDYERQKKILAERGSEGVNMYGDVSLIDNVTGKPIHAVKRMKLGFVPTVTNRHSFIINGKEYIVHNQLRLRPAIYTKLDRLGIAGADFNLAKGKNMEMKYLPAKEQMMVSINKSHVPLYTLLKDVYKVSDNSLVKTFGPELHDVQLEKYKEKRDTHIEHLYDLLHDGSHLPKPPTVEGMANAIKDKFDKTIMDGKTNLKTVGVAYDKVTPESLLHAANDVLAIHRGEKEPTWKDNLAFKSVHAAEDFIYDKFTKMAPQTLSKLKFKIDAAPSVTKTGIKPSFDGLLKSFFVDSDLVNYPQQINPYEFLENAHKITSLGEGGISSTEALPLDARNLHPSQLGFIDPVRTPDNMRAGIDNRVTALAWKDGNELKTVLRDRSGKIVQMKHTDLYDKYYTVETEPVNSNQLIRAFYRGKMVEVPPSKIEYWLPAEGMYTVSTNAIPFLKNTHAQRTAMGAKMTTQALSLKDREVPLVDTYANQLVTDTYHPKAKVAGTVTKIGKTEISIKDKSGQEHVHNIPHNFPLNYHSYMHVDPSVNIGDTVKPGQILGEHNFSKDGKMALGINANVAFMPYKGYNFEDAVVVTEQGAKKFTSNHIFQEELDIPDSSIITDSAKFKAWYPNKYSMTQQANLEDGVVRKGTKVHAGDPLILAIKHKRESPEVLLLGKMSSRISNPYSDISLAWTRDYPGEVIDVIRNPAFIKVVIKAEAPLTLGDKLAGLYGNKGIVGLILPDHEAPKTAKGEIPDIILNPAGLNSRMNLGQVYSTALGKALKAKGQGGVQYKNFNNANTFDEIKKALKDSNVTTEDDYIDPKTGKVIPKVFNGVQYFYKLMKQTETNFSARAGGEYDIDLRPVKGGEEGAKAVGSLEFYGLLANNSRAMLREAATYKAEYNPEVWAGILSGKPLPPPKPTFAWEKTKAMLAGMGVNVKKEGSYLKFLPFLDKDVLNITSGEITQPTMITDKQDPVTGLKFRPETGGLFDPVKTGGLVGKNFTHIRLARPMVNSMFERPARELLGLKQGDFKAIAEGTKTLEVDGKELRGGEAIKRALSKINVNDDLAAARKELGITTSLMKKDKLIKKIKYLSALRANGMHPAETYVNSILPVIPPVFRPIYPKEDGKLVVTDANHLYKDVVLINNELNHPLTQALGTDHPHFIELHKSLHDAVQKLQGLDGTTDDIKAAGDREPSGFLKVLVGTQPKLGYFQSKLLSRVQDLVGRATVAPNPKIGLDELGMPVPMAWKLYGTFVAGELSKNGYSLPRAKEEIEKQTLLATNVLKAEMNKRPVVINRAPTLHKYSMLGFKPQLVEGKTMHVSPLIVKSMGMDFDGDSCLSAVFARFSNCVFNVDTAKKIHYNSANSYNEKGNNIMLAQNEKIRYNYGLINLRDFPRLEETKQVKGNTEYYQVPPWIQVLTVNNGVKEWKSVESFSIHKNLNMLAVKTNTGRMLRVSDDHSLVTLDAALNYTKVKPSVGLVLPRLRKPIAEDEYELVQELDISENQEGLTHQLNAKIKLTFAFGFYIGAMISDGWVSIDSKKSTLFLSKTCPELHKYIEETCLPELFSSAIRLTKQGSVHKFSTTQDIDCYSEKVSFGSKILSLYMKQWVGHGAANKHLPEFWLQTPIDFRWGLLSGLINGDGTVSEVHAAAKKGKAQVQVKYDTISETLAYEICALAHSLDLTSSVLPYQSSSNNTTAYAVWFTQESIEIMQRNLFLTVKNKKEALARFIPGVAYKRNKYTPTLTQKQIIELRKAFPGKDINSQKWIEHHTPEETGIQKQINCIYVELGKRQHDLKTTLPRDFARNCIKLAPGFFTEGFWAKWRDMVISDDIEWELITEITPLPFLTEAYDLTIPPAYTMVTESGIVVWDTATVHVPITADAIKEVYNMLPSNNLFNTLDKRPWHTPQQETLMGLAAISKPLQAAPIHKFNTQQEALQAYQQGKVKINDHIELKMLS